MAANLQFRIVGDLPALDRRDETLAQGFTDARSACNAAQHFRDLGAVCVEVQSWDGVSGDQFGPCWTVF